MDRELRVARGRLALDESCLWSDEGERIPLSSTELALLRYLIPREGEIVARETLLSEVWGYAPNVISRAADSAIKRLRKKIDPGEPPQNLLTVFGSGYRFLRSTRGGVLPKPDGPLFGRLALLDAVREALSEGSVGLVGVGGIGKTRLALEVARTHPGSVQWVATEEVPAAIPRDGRLVVVDGVDPTPWIAVGHHVLSTGCAPMRTVLVPALEASAAAELFFHVAGESGEPVLGRLDGNPLAIVLAARRLRSVSMAQLQARMSEPFGVLVGSGRSLEASLERTWLSLPGAVREGWQRLSLFRETFTAEMAELVACDRPLLEALSAAGLIWAEVGRWSLPHCATAFVRTFHPAPGDCTERVRDWALATAQTEVWNPTHLAYALPTLRTVWRDDAPDPGLARTLATYVRRTEGPRSALEMLDSVTSSVAVEVERAACLSELGQLEEALGVLDGASGPMTPDVAVMREVWRSRVAQPLQRPALRLQAGEEALTIDGASGHVRATALNELAQTQFALGELERGMALNREAKVLAGPLSDSSILDVTLADALWRAGRLEEARQAALVAVEHSRQPDIVAMAHGWILRCDPEDSAEAERLEEIWWSLRVVHNRMIVALVLVPYRMVRGEFDRGLAIARAILKEAVMVDARAHLQGWVAVALSRTGQRALANATGRQAKEAGEVFNDLLHRCLVSEEAHELLALRDLTWRL